MAGTTRRKFTAEFKAEVAVAAHPEYLAPVQSQTQNYQQLQVLLDQWLDASIELDRLRRAGDRPPTPTRLSS
ncbi:MAG: hypothetical protein ACYCYK_14695 [Candidatus Dormibacteria bacterium]